MFSFPNSSYNLHDAMAESLSSKILALGINTLGNTEDNTENSITTLTDIPTPYYLKIDLK